MSEAAKAWLSERIDRLGDQFLYNADILELGRGDLVGNGSDLLLLLRNGSRQGVYITANPTPAHPMRDSSSEFLVDPESPIGRWDWKAKTVAWPSDPRLAFEIVLCQTLHLAKNPEALCKNAFFAGETHGSVLLVAAKRTDMVTGLSLTRWLSQYSYVEVDGEIADSPFGSGTVFALAMKM